MNVDIFIGLFTPPSHLKSVSLPGPKLSRWFWGLAVGFCIVLGDKCECERLDGNVKRKITETGAQEGGRKEQRRETSLASKYINVASQF